MKTNEQNLIRILAVFVILTASAIAATAAWQRGGTNLERCLLVALSVAVCAGAHLLPAITRSKLGWLLWVLCILATIYAHLCFLAYAGLHANKLRGEQSALSTGTREQIEAIRRALSVITSRSVTVVSAELAASDNWKILRTLTEELKEARKAQTYRDELIRLQGVATEAEVDAGVDIVTVRIAAVTGMNEGNVSLLIGLVLGGLLELFGALLWVEALRPQSMDRSLNTDLSATQPREKTQRKRHSSTQSQMEIKYELA
jgi:hypothetical protein